MSGHIWSYAAQGPEAQDRRLGINLRRLLPITEKFTQIRTSDTLETENHFSVQGRQLLHPSKTVNVKEFLL